jgi:hypothetical protein
MAGRPCVAVRDRASNYTCEEKLVGRIYAAVLVYDVSTLWRRGVKTSDG